ncbi:GH23281 [Drosophila grimshawi]|uniref:GH20561 n=2 Tax=Drosophila grimshawi TaxID=7222 RepID=B4J8A5_DROGR|nr:GH20561 [Drosophila grimshawi]EDW04563.1 GH23281 [Drosophila grimshawi]
MLGKYIDTCVRILIVIFVADFMQRLSYALAEYFLYGNHYLLEERLLTILRRAFTYNSKTICLTFGIMFLGFARFGRTGNLNQLLPSCSDFAYMPLYWIYIYAQMSQSSLSYAHWIRDAHGLDYAAGMASNYFHGYLKLSLPARNGEGLQQRMTDYEDSQNVKFGLRRLIILVPDEMFVKGLIDSPLFEKAKPLETHFINRAGVNRPFKHDVYRLNRKINNTSYYFAIEGATPMLSFFDAMHHQLSATWQMQEMKREIWLKFCKHLKGLLSTWPETRNEVELIFYSAHNSNGEHVDEAEVIINHVFKDKVIY